MKVGKDSESRFLPKVYCHPLTFTIFIFYWILMKCILSILILNPHLPANSSQIHSYLFRPLNLPVLLKKTQKTHGIRLILPMYSWM